LAESQLDQPALAGEDFDRELAAVFGSHRALERLQHRRGHAPIVLEVFCTVVKSDSSPLQHVFVVGTLVYVLEPSPAAHVVDKKGGEVGSFGLNIGHQLVETVPAGNVQATALMVGVLLDNLDVVGAGVLADDLELVFW